MKIKTWGCRGSIPVPDARMMRYGGNTTCIEVSLGDRTLILDAGTGIRNLGEDLMARGVREFDLFLSHSHWDHIQGFPFFSPIYAPHTRITIIGCSSASSQLRNILAGQMSTEYFPVSFSDLKSRIDFSDACPMEYRIGEAHLRFITVNHGIPTLGIRIDEGNRSLVFVTDNELSHPAAVTSRDQFLAFFKNADLLIHDAQFTREEYEKRKTWGHSHIEEVVALAAEAGAKTLGLFHHDPNRRDDDLAALETSYQSLCRTNGIPLTVFAVREMSEIAL